MASAPTCCPICCDTDTRVPWHRVKRLCCSKYVCKSCLYRHISSVFAEEVGGGRTELTCPLGCSKRLTDVDIRSSIRHGHFHFPRHVLLSNVFLFGFYTVYVPLSLINYCLLFQWNLLINLSLKVRHHFHQIMCRYCTTVEERAELRRYEQWSVSVAVATRSNRWKSREDVIRCPAPDCDYLWFASAPYRRSKAVNEPSGSGTEGERSRRSSGGSSGSGSSLTGLAGRKIRNSLVSAASSLMFRPPKPEVVDGHMFWVDGFDLDAQVTRQDATGDRNRHRNMDGRRLTCGKCKAQFCGLCRRPWTTVVGRGKGLLATASGLGGSSSKRQSHTGRSCGSYGKKISGAEGSSSDYSFAAQVAHARCCPGCTVRVQRSDGCNHMTCSCGVEWCYVCECRWNNWHYGCRLREDERSSSGGGGGCVVS